MCVWIALVQEMLEWQHTGPFRETGVRSITFKSNLDNTQKTSKFRYGMEESAACRFHMGLIIYLHSTVTT